MGVGAPTPPPSMTAMVLPKTFVDRTGRPKVLGTSARQQTARGAAFAPVPGVSMSTLHWLFESCISIGGVQTGLPTLSVQILWLAPLTTTRRIISEQSVGKLPLLPYSAMMVNGFIWTTYGVLEGKAGVWLPSSIGAICGTLYTLIFLRYSPAKADWLPGNRNAHIMVALGTVGVIAASILGWQKSTAAGILGMLGNLYSVAMFSGPLAAMKTVINERSTRSMPFGFTLVTTSNCVLWTFFAAFILADPVLTFPNALGLFSGLLQLSLFARFGFAKQ